MWVREFITSGPAAGAWDFKPENIAVSGFQISATALGRIGSGGLGGPPPYTSFGPLPAGSYTVTLNATATNVVPNVSCPPMVVPLVVLPSGSPPVSVPVPALAVWFALLTVLLLGITGSTRIRNRDETGMN